MAVDTEATTPLAGWTARPWPSNAPLHGRTVSALPLSASVHAEALWKAFGGAANPEIWRYIPDGPFADLSAFADWLGRTETRQDWVSFAIAPRGEAPLGIANYMRIDPANGVAEIGCIVLGAGLARTRAATEAMALLASRIFEEYGYRRYEWKCDDRNVPSKRAAERLGFRFEGVFRHHMVVKGENRDTAWFAITDAEWPARKARFARWLAAENFGPDGRQTTSLATLAL